MSPELLNVWAGIVLATLYGMSRRLYNLRILTLFRETSGYDFDMFVSNNIIRTIRKLELCCGFVEAASNGV